MITRSAGVGARGEAELHVRASIIAIDGPAASGKSAVGALVAQRLGYRFVDTGAMYRAVTWAALRRGIDAADEAAVAAMARAVPVSVRADGVTRVFIGGEDATPHLRDAAVEAGVSAVSRVPAVRAELVKIQRRLAAEGRVVMAGRDIGTVVLPGADLKIYLDASPAVRAERRAAQLRESGQQPDIDALRSEITRRDGIDSTRALSPLAAAPEAVRIDTDTLTIDDVVSRIVAAAGA